MTWTEIPTDCSAPRPPILVNRAQRKFFHVGCNRWRCRGCARRKGTTVVKRMMLVEPTHLLTFSLRRAATADDFPELQAKKRLFFDWMRRKPWGLVKCGWVRELGGEHGQPHLHCPVRMRGQYLPFKRIQEFCANIGLGVPDFQRIWRKEQAVRYVAKYVAKGIAEPQNGSSSGSDCQGADVDEGVRPGSHAGPRPRARRAFRRFGLSPGLTLPKNPDWELATREDNLPEELSVLRLLFSPRGEFLTYAVPSG